MYPTLFTAPGLKRFAEAVDTERQAQLAKWGDQKHRDGTCAEYYVGMADQARNDVEHAAESLNGPRWSLILLEEVYEALAETDPAKLRAELIQVAAVCAAWIHDLDTRPHSMICAHCGEQIPTSDVGYTWSAPLVPPGTPENLAPRFHIDRPECQAACHALSDAARAERLNASPTAALLATPCDACQHTLNWHRNYEGCTVPLCSCGRFQSPADEGSSAP
ncbi:hypothetical protein [Streptomyces marianii]|uniref:hypothetical protein n=1 Tax=Streptomyces marianii TaxID=1817406 RepID=UPI0018F8BD96|nr:hypothetical protein [Streptomyces marianii]